MTTEELAKYRTIVDEFMLVTILLYNEQQLARSSLSCAEMAVTAIQKAFSRMAEEQDVHF